MLTVMYPYFPPPPAAECKPLQGRPVLDDARAAHDRAVALDPDNAMLHWNRAMTLLLAGDYPEGFAEYEWRRRRPDRPPRSFPSPTWDGSDPAGRRILLHAEQGDRKSTRLNSSH